MHLQSLELVGFKSFADKTTFNFHEGVTAIVGPNGCGKSNVLDAVRWVLGEQSAKALRGGEMADVIFSGTESRKPLGFAEVSLTFTECDQELGVDWHDVRVTRRVYRDGNSEYLLNKNVCRLKDIHGLFADTGVGRSAYSIMEQGKIDQILSSRPEDRRAVFEEAAGITKYKTQKREALRKLEATEANLLRIGDVIKEVKRQIGSLQRQAGKARRYQAILTDLRVLDTHHSRREFDRLSAEAEESRAQAASLSAREEKAQDAIRESEAKATREREELAGIEGQINEARGEQQLLQNDLHSNRSRIEFNQQRGEELRGLMQRYQAEIDAAEAKKEQQAAEIQAASDQIEKIAALLLTQENDATGFENRLAAAREERAANETELHDLQVGLSRLEARVENLLAEVQGTAARREATAARITELSSAAEEASKSLEEKRGQLAAGRSSMESGRHTLEGLIAQLQVAERESVAHQGRTGEAEEELHAVERLVTEKRSRLEILQQLNEQGEGLAAGSQALLQASDQPDHIRAALAGALVSHLDVENRFVAAIEAALGRSLHAVVLDDPARADEIFHSLKSRDLGQAVLALPSFAAEIPQPSDRSLPAGTLGWAADKVGAPEKLRGLVQVLLRDVVLVNDLRAALDLRALHPGLALATLEGEFLSASGLLFGGKATAQSDSILSRRAMVTALAAELEELEQRRAAMLSAREMARTAMATAVALVEEVRQRQQSAHARNATSEKELMLLERDYHEAESRLRTLESERTTLQSQIAAADRRLEDLEGDIQRSREELTTRQDRVRELTTACAEAEAAETEVAAQLTELRLLVATERQRHESLVQQREPMTARARELEEIISGRRADIENGSRRLETQAAESAEAEKAIARLTADLGALEQTLEKLAAARAEKLAEATRIEAALRSARDVISELRDERGRHEVRQTQLQLRLDHLAEHVARRYQVDLREFAPDQYAFQKTLRAQTTRRGRTEMVTAEGEPAAMSADDDASPAGQSDAPAVPEADLERLIAELTRQLDQMGPVNLDAVQEYDELEERFRFLENQNSDLVKARAELLDVIARINETTQKLFADTFAQVRINFREMFAELFGGGKADLRLMDENDPLECGIDIIAKPPGKQLQSVSLLSGGERTMTAVALLFAIYMVRPSPFCILDEMDAPLDESNINRFIKMLDRFVDQSQFIIITHNKRTIAKADVLYGVTMEERGVSRLVGMKMAPAPNAQAAGETPKVGAQRNLSLEEEPALAASN